MTKTELKKTLDRALIALVEVEIAGAEENAEIDQISVECKNRMIDESVMVCALLGCSREDIIAWAKGDL